MAFTKNFTGSGSEENQEYVGLCQEFPQLCSRNESPVGALKGIRSLVDKENIRPDIKEKIT